MTVEHQATWTCGRCKRTETTAGPAPRNWNAAAFSALAAAPVQQAHGVPGSLGWSYIGDLCNECGGDLIGWAKGTDADDRDRELWMLRVEVEVYRAERTEVTT